MKRLNLAILSSLFSSSFVMANGVDIYNDVYGLKNKSSHTNGIFYLREVRTYTPWAWGQKFTQTYSNGTLIFGNSSQQAGSGKIWFGRAGDIGYITANFSAKDIYLTGTLGAGNSAKTGGGATLNFVSSNNATLQDWNLELLKAGTQNSHFSLRANAIDSKNIAVKNETGGNIAFGAGNFNFHATSISSHGKVVFEGANENGGNGEIKIDSLSLTNGELNLQKAHNVKIEISDIAMNNTNFQSQGMSGRLSWTNHQDIKGSYKQTKDSLVLEGLIKPQDALTFQALSVDATRARIELDGKTLSAASDIKLRDLILKNNGSATFANLVLDRGGSIGIHGGVIEVSKDFEIHGSVKFFSNQAGQTPLKIVGETKIIATGRGRNDPILSIYNINKLKGVRVGEEYTLLASDQGITALDLNGKSILDFVGFYESEGGLRFDNTYSFDYKGLTITKTFSTNSLGFKVETSKNPINPYDPNRVEYWIYHRGGEDLVNQVNALGNGAMDLFQDLMIAKNNVIWANDMIMGQEIDYLVRVGQSIQNTIEQLESLQRKTSDLDLLQFSIDTAKGNRLTRLSLQRKIKLFNPKEQTDMWGLAIASAKATRLEKGMLYGANVGYDTMIENFLLGGYAAYGYGISKGGLIQANSHNAGIGIYGRVFIENNELDFDARGMMGWKQEAIRGNEPISEQFEQSYHYNTKRADVNLDYGYAFGLWRDQITIKPLVAINYTYLTHSRINGEASYSNHQDLAILAQGDSGHILGASLGVETRIATGKSSYWRVLFEASQDIYSTLAKNKQVQFVGNNNWIDVENQDINNLSFALSLGGEIGLFDRAFVSFSVGSELGALQKDNKLAGNIGVEYSF